MTDVYVQFRLDDNTKKEYVPFVGVWGDHALLDRNEIPEDALIISRYSCLPFYGALEDEITKAGSRLVTCIEDHLYLANMKWYDAVEDLTPKTWFALDETAPCDQGYVVKGLTYSRKFKWQTHMRAKTQRELKEVVGRCQRDLLLGGHDLVIREYVPLKSHGEQAGGLPMSEEWRCFFAGKTPVTSGFYWSGAEVDKKREEIPPEAQQLAQTVANRVSVDLHSEKSLLAIDVAQTEKGDWVLIEINNGSLSGLSTITPKKFYTKLKEVYCG